MKFINRIIIVCFCTSSILMQGQTVDNKTLRNFVTTTINDHFQERPDSLNRVFFLPYVKNHFDSILFELEENDLDSDRFVITTEKDLKSEHGLPSPITLYYVKAIVTRPDTILVNIEEYQVEFKNYFLFKRPIRYVVCQGRGEHFTDGTFIFDRINSSWSFVSGRLRKLEWREKLFENK